MITLYLVEKEILKKPVLYLSDFFERNKELYYDNLMKVRSNGNIKQWFKFFLVGVIETAKTGVTTFDAILKLKKEIENKIQDSGKHVQQLLKLMDRLYHNPVIDQQGISAHTQVSKNTAYKLLDELVQLKILQEITGGKRGRVYMFGDYVQLFKK